MESEISLIAGWIKRLLVLVNFHWSCSTKESLPKRREHCFSASCKGAKEKRELYIKTYWPSGFLGPIRAKESKRSQRTHVPATIHLWVSGSSFQVPDPRSRIQVPGLRLPALHGGEIQWLHEKVSSDHLPTAFTDNKS